MTATCSIGGCLGVGRWRGMCSKHYTRWRKTGSTDLSMKSRPARLLAMQDAHAEACGGRPIPGHLGYFASRDGTIYSAIWARGFRAPIPLATHHARDGYLTVRIRGKVFRVHQLVALTFLGPCPAGMQTRHLNGVRDDPRLENLAYGTPKENAADRVRHGTQTYGESAPNSRWSDAEVAEAVQLYLATPLTQREVGALFGTTQQVVSRWVKGARTGGPRRYATNHATTTAATPEAAARIAALAKGGERR